MNIEKSYTKNPDLINNHLLLRFGPSSVRTCYTVIILLQKPNDWWVVSVSRYDYKRD